jgi:hypothetical protein
MKDGAWCTVHGKMVVIKDGARRGADSVPGSSILQQQRASRPYFINFSYYFS